MSDARLTAYTSSVEVRACGRVWTLDRAASLEELWDAMAEGDGAFDDERLPYWTELWPSSVALAEWLLLRREEIVSRRCLDLGCGLGLTSMVGQWLGGRVLGMDYEEQALRFARQNAERNNVPQPLWTVMDWRRPAVVRRSVDVVWGGDIMYERRFVAPVLDFLEHVLARQGKVWIAEPCRTVYDAFRAEVYRRKWRGRRVHTMIVDPVYAQPARVTVHVWELIRC
ncbi:MAG: methyltransferase domain-containing protein [Desulfovibrionaceae bacterium]|nr:methyltransferase domain-containing protein [Desulfovibrionaceae bacterium]